MVLQLSFRKLSILILGFIALCLNGLALTNCNMSLNVTKIASTCNSKGAISVSPIGGTAPFTYSWSNGSSLSLIDTLTVSAIYTVTVTDGIGCVTTQSISDSIGDSLFLIIQAYSNIECFGKNDGSLCVSPFGGTAPFKYSWSSGVSGVPTGFLSSANNLTAGSYTITVTDANSCTSTASAVVTQPATPLKIKFQYDTVQLIGKSSIKVITAVSGGTFPYNYSWSGGNLIKDSMATLSTNTNYTLTVSDDAGCSVNASINIPFDSLTFVPALVLNLNTFPCSDSIACNGKAFTDVSGGTPPYTYWYSNSKTNSPLDSNLCAGLYTAHVKDKTGLQDSMTFVIAKPKLYFVDTISYPSYPSQSVLSASAIHQCLINYSAQVDSVIIHDLEWMTNSKDSVKVNWFVFYGGSYLVITVNYFAPSTIDYPIFQLSLYCGSANAKAETTSPSGYLVAKEKYFLNRTPTGINDYSMGFNSSAKIYPNPFADNLNLHFGSTDNYRVSIFDVTGNPILINIPKNGTSDQLLNLESLDKGVYLVKFESSKSGVQYLKAIKQ